MHQTISINKTWDYKNNTGFLPTKNFTSNRKIQIDWQTVIQFTELLRGLPESEPIFVHGKVWNSTPNKTSRATLYPLWHSYYYHPRTSAYSRLSFTIFRCFNRKCGQKTRTRQYDNNSKNIPTHYCRARK